MFLHDHIYAPASSHSKTCGIAVLCDREFRIVAGCRLPQEIIFSHSHDGISQSFNGARLCVVSFVSSLHVLERYVCLRSASLVAFQGGQAAVQPGKLGDLMLHETAVAWIRQKERTTLPTRPWAENSRQLGARLKRIACEINVEHDVAGLCKELPTRLLKLQQRGGRKLRR